MVAIVNYFQVKYQTDCNPWVATLGPTPEKIFDPKTGKEDFTEQKKVVDFLENWQPGQQWIPQQICLHFKVRGRKYHKADRIYHNKVGLFISENAVDKLRPWLEKAGHILPLDVVNSDEKFYFWWVPWVEESVDLGRSEKFPNGITVKRYAINAGKVKSLTAFRTHYKGMYKPEAQGTILVSDDFRKAWDDAGLTGIDFNPAVTTFDIGTAITRAFAER